MESVDICNIALVDLGQPTITALTDDSEIARACNIVYEPVRDELMKKHPWNFAMVRAELVGATTPDVDKWVTATAYAKDEEIEYLGVYYTCLIAHTSGVFGDDLTAVKWETFTDWKTAITYLEGKMVYNSGVHYVCIVDHTAGTFATDLTSLYWTATSDPIYEFTYAYFLPTDLLRVFHMYGDYVYKVEGGVLYTDASPVDVRYISLKTDPDDYSPEFVAALAAELSARVALKVTNSRAVAGDAKTDAKVKKMDALGIDGQSGGTPEEAQCDDWLNVR